MLFDSSQVFCATFVWLLPLELLLVEAAGAAATTAALAPTAELALTAALALTGTLASAAALAPPTPLLLLLLASDIVLAC